MRKQEADKVYFIGAGGIGMSALARYFLSQGKTVGGYDRVSTALTDQLTREGVSICFDDDPALISEEFLQSDNTLVIYTPAVPDSHRQLKYFLESGFRVIKRSVALGEAFNRGRGIGVAGTHGKTSISTTLAHLLHASPLGCNAFLGGISKNISSNLYLDPPSEIILAEADEYDRSFLTLFPEIAVLSSMDSDHFDIYGDAESIRESYEAFIAQISKGGKLILKHGLDPHIPDYVQPFTYAPDNKEADYHITEIEALGPNYRFKVQTPDGELPAITLQVPGMLNVENSLAAIAVAHQLGVDSETMVSALANYSGVERRFDVQLMDEERVYIDDYAHHPTEIKAFLSSVRAIFPGKKLTAVFQPHLFSRTRDFADDFARSLEMLDQLILLDIYPAREEPIPGVSSQMLLEKIRMKEKVLIEKEQLIRVLSEREPEVLLTMGAGDINQLVAPLKDWMESRQ